MKITCKFSGLDFRAEGFNRSTSIKGAHPIFKLEQGQLLALLPRWADKSFSYVTTKDVDATGQWNEDKQKQFIAESRLLFLALLKSTERVWFDVPAIPHHSTVQRYMERLKKYILWQNMSGIDATKLPKYMIRADEGKWYSTIANISNYLEAWESTEREWRNQYREELIGRRLREKEEQLDRLIHNGITRSGYAVDRLCEWAMEAGRVPAHKRVAWTKVFMARDFVDIINLDSTEIRNCAQFMLGKLTVGTTYKSAVMRHLEKIQHDNNYKNSVGGDLTKEDLADLEAAEKEWKGGPRILNINPGAEIEARNRKIAAATAPASQPNRADYANLFEFMRAVSAWNLAEAERAKAKMIEEFEIERAKRENLDIITDEEVVLEEADPRQLGLDIFRIVGDDNTNDGEEK